MHFSNAAIPRSRSSTNTNRRIGAMNHDGAKAAQALRLQPFARAPLAGERGAGGTPAPRGGTWTVLRSLIVILAALSMVSCATAPKEETKFNVQLRKKWDRLEMHREGSKTIWLVTSPGGIGGARVTLEQGRWPRNVRVHLQYEEQRGFPRVEGFLYVTGDGHRGELKAAEIRPDYAEVRLPASALQDGINFVDIEWVDFFR